MASEHESNAKLAAQAVKVVLRVESEMGAEGTPGPVPNGVSLPPVFHLLTVQLTHNMFKYKPYQFTNWRRAKVLVLSP